MAIERLDRAFNEAKETVLGIDRNSWGTQLVKASWGVESTLEVLSYDLVISHFHHHKMQLFMYLKLLSVAADTGTLYMT
jgi:hypothetical protein